MGYWVIELLDTDIFQLHEYFNPMSIDLINSF